jgi:hypothetical protein
MAFDVLQKVIQETEGTGKNPMAVMLGRRGGLKGGAARVARMTSEELRESAKRAAVARWNAHKDKEPDT